MLHADFLWRDVMRCAARKYFSLILVIAVVVSLFSACDAEAAGGDDSVEISSYDASVAKIAEGMGLGTAEAEILYELLLASGLEGEIKYVTSWDDPETGGVYYRVRTNTSKREIYPDDGSAYGSTIKDGETVYSLTPNDNVESDETEYRDSAVEAPESSADSIYSDTTSTTYEPETAESETDAESTAPEKATDADTTTADTSAVTSANTTSADTTTSEPANTGTIEIVLNTNSMKCHYPDCSAALRMNDENKKIIYVSSLDEVFAMGYEPCGICMKGVG